MVSGPYVPDRGHLIWVSMSEVAGHEQAGRRPALVLSPAAANSVLGLAVCCPITSKAKGYPFEVSLPAGLAVTGVILVDQIRSFDWRARKADFIASAPDTTLSAVGTILSLLLPFK